MNEIKQRKQQTHVLLKDGRILTTEKTPEEIGRYIQENYHITIEGELHSRFDIVSAVPVNMDDVESFILQQNKELKTKLLEKKHRLKTEQGKEMTLEYAKNYVKEHT